MVEAIDIKATASPESFYTARLTGMKSGAGWVEGGLCPFHQDTKTGSFRVNLDTGAYKCFSCGASGGDVIDFAMQQDDVDFPTTIKALAAEYGIAETPLTAKQIEVIRLRQQQAKHDDLDDGIFHEAHIILQCVSGRENNRNLEHNRQFREARPDWSQYPKEVWDRELLAATRLKKLLNHRISKSRAASLDLMRLRLRRF